jgi:hypothetical protein
MSRNCLIACVTRLFARSTNLARGSRGEPVPPCSALFMAYSQFVASIFSPIFSFCANGNGSRTRRRQQCRAPLLCSRKGFFERRRMARGERLRLPLRGSQGPK